MNAIQRPSRPRRLQTTIMFFKGRNGVREEDADVDAERERIMNLLGGPPPGPAEPAENTSGVVTKKENVLTWKATCWKKRKKLIEIFYERCGTYKDDKDYQGRQLRSIRLANKRLRRDPKGNLYQISKVARKEAITYWGLKRVLDTYKRNLWRLRHPIKDPLPPQPKKLDNYREELLAKVYEWRLMSLQ